jgi:hypothetical protein
VQGFKMRFKSIAQQKFLFAKHPEVAKEFAEHTPKSAYKTLPEHVRDKNRLKEYTKKHRRPKNGTT